MANMFSVNARFEYDLQRILRNKGLEERGKVQQAIDSEVLRACDQYIPFDTGALKNSGTLSTEIGSGSVVYGGANAPYARKQYYIPMPHHEGRTAYWFEKMKENGGKDKILEVARRAVNEA